MEPTVTLLLTYKLETSLDATSKDLRFDLKIVTRLDLRLAMKDFSASLIPSEINI